MMVLDTSVLVEGLGAGGSKREALRGAIALRQRIVVPALVLYEWLRGPRVPQELRAQEALFPVSEALPFGPEEARVAARLHEYLGAPRGRDMDLAVAAHALVWNATLWTLRADAFRDIPDLKVRS